MPAIRFLFPDAGSTIGHIDANEPEGAVRAASDPDKSFTRIVVQTEGDAAITDEVVLFFRHEEAGSSVPSFEKSTSNGSVRRVTPDSAASHKYLAFFQFTTKAAGVWTVTAHLNRNGALLDGDSIRVRVVTTLWPFIDGNGDEVDGSFGGAVHGFTWFRPVKNLVLPGHTIPEPNRNRVPHPPGKLKSDALDLVTGGDKDGIAPFNGTVTLKRRLSSSDPSLGHYLNIKGAIADNVGRVVRYEALIAHLDATVGQGEKVILGQALGRQATQNIIHFGLINHDDQDGPQEVGGILGDETKMPGGGRSTFLASNHQAASSFWRPAGPYYKSLRDRIRAALLQKRFGHP